MTATMKDQLSDTETGQILEGLLQLNMVVFFELRQMTGFC
jgi:hypothetical protein